VPWHYHNITQDTFYVVEGTLRIFLQEPKEEMRLTRPAARSAPRSAQREGADHAFDVGDSAQWSRNRFDTRSGARECQTPFWVELSVGGWRFRIARKHRPAMNAN